MNIWNISSNVQVKVIDSVKYNNIIYYVVEYPGYFDPPWTNYQLTKWRGLFKYESYWVGERSVEMRYDKKMKLVYIVTTMWDTLAFLDSTPPRKFDQYNEVEFNGKKYSLAIKCHPDPLYPYLCKAYTFMVYQCELDHSTCVPFSFQYDDGYVREMNIEYGNAPNDINVYFNIGDYPGEKTLIFTQGNEPRCYVEGCEILSQP